MPRHAHPNPQLYAPRWWNQRPTEYDVDLSNPAVWQEADDTATVVEGASDHADDNTVCSICAAPVEQSELLVRLQYLHMFHVGCFNHYLHGTSRAVGCPNCRGRARIIARFRYAARRGWGAR